MYETTMTLAEIKSMYGEDIARECSMMNHDDVKEFNTCTYEAIIVRAFKPIYAEMDYFVSSENIVENAVELPVEIDDGMDMDF